MSTREITKGLWGNFKDSNGQLRTFKTTQLLELEKADFDHVVSSYPSIKETLAASPRKTLEVTSQIIYSSRARR